VLSGLREELTLARIAKHSTELEELDVEGILAFAERVLPRAAGSLGAGPARAAPAVPTAVLPGRNDLRRPSVRWNRGNRAGFQLLARDSPCGGWGGGPHFPQMEPHGQLAPGGRAVLDRSVGASATFEASSIVSRIFTVEQIDELIAEDRQRQ
jgi:hypothetical protein